MLIHRLAESRTRAVDEHPYLAGTVDGGEGVRVHALTTHGKGMGDLEHGVHAEDLCEVGANASEHLVGEEDIALDLPGQVLYRAGVGQAELSSPLGK